MNRKEILKSIDNFIKTNQLDVDLYKETNKLISAYVYVKYNMPRISTFIEDIQSTVWVALVPNLHKFKNLKVEWSTFLHYYTKKVMWHDYYNMYNHIHAPVPSRRPLLDYVGDVINGDMSHEEYTEKFLNGKYKGYNTLTSLKAITSLSTHQPGIYANLVPDGEESKEDGVLYVSVHANPEQMIVKHMLVKEIQYRLLHIFQDDYRRPIITDRIIPVLLNIGEAKTVSQIAREYNTLSATMSVRLQSAIKHIHLDNKLMKLIEEYKGELWVTG